MPAEVGEIQNEHLEYCQNDVKVLGRSGARCAGGQNAPCAIVETHDLDRLDRGGLLTIALALVLEGGIIFGRGTLLPYHDSWSFASNTAANDGGKRHLPRDAREFGWGSI